MNADLLKVKLSADVVLLAVKSGAIIFSRSVKDKRLGDISSWRCCLLSISENSGRIKFTSLARAEVGKNIIDISNSLRIIKIPQFDF